VHRPWKWTGAAFGACALAGGLLGAGPLTGGVAAAAQRVPAAGATGAVRLPPASSGPSAAAAAGGGSGSTAAGGGSAGTAAGGAPSAGAAQATTSVTVSGHGLGPGWGMGQWGSYGYASLAGYKWPYSKILGHYYSGQHLSHLATATESAPIDVDLSELDGTKVTTLKANRRGAHVTVNGAKRWGTRRITHTATTIVVRANVGDVRVDLNGRWRAYQGYIELTPDDRTVNVVPLESYVAGVVPSESIASWGAAGGEAALETQAVAARTYAINYVDQAGRICDTEECQVYDGDPGTNPGLDGYVKYSDKAATATAGVVVCAMAASTCPAADIDETQYSASTGGYTSGQGFPAVTDAGDAVGSNPWHNWTAHLSISQLDAAFPNLGRLTALEVTARNGHGTWGGRAVTVEVTGTKGSTSLSGSSFEDDFGLASNWFRFATQP